jgi:hypothetical protein
MFFGEADAVRVHGLLHWRAYHHTGNLTRRSEGRHDLSLRTRASRSLAPPAA